MLWLLVCVIEFMTVKQTMMPMPGRVGHQKRIRRLVRSLAEPTANHIAIWEECFWRWRSVSEVLTESLPGFEDSNNRLPIPLSLEVCLNLLS
jgi:hypothetical protein